MLRSAADIATLGIEYHRDAGMRVMDMCDQPLQRILGAERREMRDLRLECAHVGRGGIDDGAAEAEYRIGVIIQHRRQALRFRVEPDTEQGVGFEPALAQ